MRILVVTGSYPPMKCGVGAYTQRLVVALSGCEKVNVVVLTDVRARDFVEQAGLEVLPVISSWRFRNLLHIVKCVIQKKPDVIHFQYPTQGYNGSAVILLPMLFRILRVPCVQTWHEPRSGGNPWFLALGLDVLVSVRKELMPKLSAFIQRTHRKIKLVYIPAASLLPTVSLNDEDRLKIRNQYVSGNEILLSFYGFVAPLKGIEVLFDIVANTDSRLLMVCDFNLSNGYHKTLLNMIQVMGIESRVNIMGFLPDEQLATILAISDAAVFPFRDGAAAWNTSIDGAAVQGVFTLTTSQFESGYSEDKNTYYAKPGNLKEMIIAIHKHAGHRVSFKESKSVWQNIAEQHINIYSNLT